MPDLHKRSRVNCFAETVLAQHPKHGRAVYCTIVRYHLEEKVKFVEHAV